MPRNNIKSKLMILYPRELLVRTDSYMVFSMVKYIRGHNFMQEFCHIPLDYIFVQYMQREYNSHKVCQDYIREVRASEIIFTDNSKS